LFDLISPSHPDASATHTNVAMVCQELKQSSEGLTHLQIALERRTASLGADHMQVAVTHHSLALAFSNIGAFRNAITHEKETKRIFTGKLGPASSAVTQSRYLIQKFAEAAVAVEARGKVDILGTSPLRWTPIRSSGLAPRQQASVNEVLTYLARQVAIREAQEKEAGSSEQAAIENSANRKAANGGGAADGAADEAANGAAPNGVAAKTTKSKARRDKKKAAARKKKAKKNAAAPTTDATA